MKNLELQTFGVSPLDTKELRSCYGGEEQKPSEDNLFALVGHYGSVIIKGLVIFSQEGGRNAGLTVH